MVRNIYVHIGQIVTERIEESGQGYAPFYGINVGYAHEIAHQARSRGSACHVWYVLIEIQDPADFKEIIRESLVDDYAKLFC